MKTRSLLTVALLVFSIAVAAAYDIPGALPISKLADAQKKARDSKKLITLVYKGADDTCPHCAAAAENGMASVRGSVPVVITEEEANDAALVSKLPPAVQKALEGRRTGAWVQFAVLDADLTKVVATGDRTTLETDKKAIREFAGKVREAKKELK